MEHIIKIAVDGDLPSFLPEMMGVLRADLDGYDVLVEEFRFPGIPENSTLEDSVKTLHHMAEKRNEFVSKLENSGRRILLFCTGTEMDLLESMPESLHRDFFESTGLNPVALRDVPYDAVFSFGKGFSQPSKFWMGHPHIRVFDTLCNRKILYGNVLQELKIILGIPRPLEIERKFLVAHAGEIPDSRTCEIYQTYVVLLNGEKSRIRARGENGVFLYFQTTKKAISDMRREEVERRLSREEYLELMAFADPQKRTIHKLRTCFVHHNRYFELDTFLEPAMRNRLLEIELTSEGQEVDLPPFLDIIAEVTAEKEYRNSQIARKENFQ